MNQPFIFFIMGMVLFLFGMLQLSAGVQKLLSARIRAYIRYSVQKPLYGFLIGTLSTILLQSSTATSVIALGMVSAGLITFYHSLGIILGADIGTTLTVQLVVWKVTALSPLIIIGGGTVWIAGKDKWKPVGEVVFYLGLMFFGLDMMAQAAAPLKENRDFIEFLKNANNPLLGLLAGLVFTAIVHASSIPISILVILAQHGLIGIENALPVVFGANIGTTATVLLAGITTNIGGRRTATAHFLTKIVGVAISFAALPFFIYILAQLTSSAAQQIALGHFLFNVLIFLVFFFILKPFARLVEKILPGDEHSIPLWPEFLDKQLLSQPTLALEAVRKEMTRQYTLTLKIVLDSLRLIFNYSDEIRKDTKYIGMVVNSLRKEIVKYLLKVSTRATGPDSKVLLTYTVITDDIASIAKHADNILDLSRINARNRTDFSAAAKAELNEIGELVKSNLELVLELNAQTPGGGREIAEKILLQENTIDRLVQEAREKHSERFHQHTCQAESAPIFIEILINMERISDHCENIAQYFLEYRNQGVRTGKLLASEKAE